MNNTFKVNGKYIEVSRDDVNNQYYIYNYYNNRTIVAGEDVVLYLQNENKVDKQSPLYSFVNKRKKFNIIDFHLITLKVPNNLIYKFSKYTYFTNKNLVFLFSIIISIILLFVNPNIFKLRIHNDTSSMVHYAIYIYIIQFIILTLHEISHFYFYHKEFKSSYSIFGITLRYLSLLLFFTSVPFINLIKIENKKKLILAGIKTQTFILGVSSVVALVFPTIASNIYFQLFFWLNSLLIVANCLPFLKLDGYWYLSTLLKNNNYMSYFFNMLKGKEKFNYVIFIVAILNILVILLLLLSSIYYAQQILTKNIWKG